ncbi:MAG TPA: SDR family NAD(P)-dependent oxidoreductase, partial [Caldilineaceae bacterium]|nr:SDR family NAD(P)-dependent oxidoreductase [Caldilineaceae bacterium]
MQSKRRNTGVRAHEARTVAAWLVTGAAAAWLIKQRLRQQTRSLAGETVLITGGSRGLGLILAHEFARAGCRLAICARDEEELAHARIQLQQAGAEVLTVVCDVGERDEVDLMVEQVTRHDGPIDILVNTAGIIQVGPYAALKLRDFEQALDTIFWGMVYTSMAVVPQMRARGHG